MKGKLDMNHYPHRKSCICEKKLGYERKRSGSLEQDVFTEELPAESPWASMDTSPPF